MHPLVPGLGGTTFTAETLAVAFTLIVKVPLPLFLIWAALTGPCSAFESLYLKPLVASPLQNGLPFSPVPWGSGNVCSVGVPPSARTVSVAPLATGSPTIVFVLATSLALPTMLRLSGVLGFLTTSWLPRII
jgi:hypothetical protein